MKKFLLALFLIGTAFPVWADGLNNLPNNNFLSANVPIGSAVSVTTSTARDVTSLSLPPGNWWVCGNLSNSVGGATVVAFTEAYISTASNTRATSPNGGAYIFDQQSKTAGTTSSYYIGCQRFSFAVTTTVYLGIFSSFSGSTLTAYGFLSALQIR